MMISLPEEPPHGSALKEVQGFYPYAENGGTIASIGGDGFVVMAADTRLSSGYSILSRNQDKITKLTSSTVFGSCGCWCDSLTFNKALHFRLQYYLYENNKPISTVATAQLVSNMLYQKRFFPYYVANMVAGLDSNGQGHVYSYDPVGSTEKHTYRAQGAACSLIQPFLDCIIRKGNQTVIHESMAVITKEKAIAILKDAFLAAAEREITTGDELQLMIVTPEGVEEEHFPLRKD